MFAKRLEILAQHLERQDVLRATGVRLARNFNMGTWYSPGVCGTAACAMGEACFIPEFNVLGLELLQLAAQSGGYPAFKGRTGFDAACIFFGVSYDDAVHLFDSFEYYRHTDPAIVARRIRAFIARGGRMPPRDEEFVPLCWTSGVNLCAGHGK